MSEITETASNWDGRRWDAVSSRTPLADDFFVYAVRSTGVFCLPGCASRQPNRSNVLFFDTPNAAKEAGFRPCKRCRPEGGIDDTRTDLITHACRRLEREESEPSLTALAREAGFSPAHFQKLFKAHTGLSPKQYAKAVRARRLREALERGASVTDAIYEAGYASARRAYDDAERLGITPSHFGQQSKAEKIRYATADSALGPIIVAGTERGICAIEFAESREELRERIRSRFPAAVLEEADNAFSTWLTDLLTFIGTPSEGLDLPLDIQGTAFQRRVWRALRDIPTGTTVTYGELAQRLDVPRGARAVASAVAANRIAIAVPCHRVVREDGKLTGFRWGIERKRRLLAREKSVPDRGPG